MPTVTREITATDRENIQWFNENVLPKLPGGEDTQNMWEILRDEVKAIKAEVARKEITKTIPSNAEIYGWGEEWAQAEITRHLKAIAGAIDNSFIRQEPREKWPKTLLERLERERAREAEWTR